jgi:glutamate/tyrosine decarboxylase-like PLP-dependent enzyme
MLKPTTDASVTTGLSEAIEALLPALEEFLRFEDRDLAASQYAQWFSSLNEPLPQRGRGAEKTLQTLKEVVIPHGLRIGAPGFAGWVTTMPTVVPVAAALSASVAGAQRYWVQPFNFLEHLALEWLGELLGLPASYQGTFTSGGSTANLIAVRWIGVQLSRLQPRAIGAFTGRDRLGGAPRDGRRRNARASEATQCICPTPGRAR